MTAHCSAWRAKDMKKSAVWVLYDATNAFACADPLRLCDATQKWMKDDGWHYQADLGTWSCSSIQSKHDEIHFHPGSGSLMGHTWAPGLFVIDYTMEVQKWQGSEQNNSFVVHEPITNKKVDIGLGVFVDDIGRMYMQKEGETSQELVARTVESSTALENS